MSIGVTSIKDSVPSSPKRDYDGNSVLTPLNSDVQVATILELERELLLVQAKIMLAQKNIECSALSPEEVASLLCKEGLYQDACS